jgi:hypothetical protein
MVQSARVLTYVKLATICNKDLAKTVHARAV